MPITIPPELIPLLKEAGASRGPIDELGLAGKLTETLGGRELSAEERQGALAEIEALRFARAPNSRGSIWGIYWTELGAMVFDNGSRSSSPDIAHVDGDVASHWIERSQTVAHPTLKARFADLAWEIGRYKKLSIKITHDLPHRAIDNYLLAVEQGLFEDEAIAWLWIDRAIELAQQIKDDTRIEAAKRAAFSLFKKLSAHGGRPTQGWRFDDILWRRFGRKLSDRDRKTMVEALEQDLSRMTNRADPSTFDPISSKDVANSLRRWREAAGEKDEAMRAFATSAQAVRDASKMASGLTAVGWLEGLLLDYRQHGMHSEAADVEVEIGRRAVDAEKEMKLASVPIDVPRDEMEAWADQVAGHDVTSGIWRIAKVCLLSEGKSRESVQSMVKDSAFLSFIPMTLTGPGGFTEATVGGMKDDIDGRTMMHAAQLLGWHSSFNNFAFKRFREKHDISVTEMLAQLKACPFFEAESYPLLEAGLADWLAGRFVQSIHVLVPQVEAALRNCLRTLGGNVMKPNDYGGFYAITMADILSHRVFKAKFPNDFRFHLRALYTDPRGLNVRNHVAHGLLHSASCGLGLSNLVVHSLLLISMLGINRADQPPA